MKSGVDGEVFIAIEVGENVGTFCLVDNQTFRRVKINDVISPCRQIISGNISTNGVNLHHPTIVSSKY